MYIHLKQSGEQLTDTGTSWTYEAVLRSAERIKELYDNKTEMSISGLCVVSGGGNIFRGREFSGDAIAPELKRNADALGRWGTVMNTYMLQGALESIGVPCQIFMAIGMELHDSVLGFAEPYDVARVNQAYADGKVVLLAGGTGEDGCTTDAAVVEYAIRQAEALPEKSSRAYKATGVDGVYDNDPNKFPDACFYPEITAAEMLADYDHFGVVDERSLHALEHTTANVNLQIYNGDKYSVHDVILASKNGDIKGSLVHTGRQ